MTETALPALREDRDRDDPVDDRRRLPAALSRVSWPVVAAVVLSALWTIWFVLQCKQYFIQPDELEYLKQSRRIAEQWHPILPGERYFTSWSQLQPLLLAPVWGLFDDTNRAHQVMGVVNALIMASTAIPAYLLARRVVVRRWPAVLVAFLSVAIPWMAAASTMMTEVTAYPAFVWGALGVHQAIARPGPRSDLAGVLGVGLAFAARPQLAVLGPALVAGVLVQELRYVARGGDPLTPRRERIRAGARAAVRRHWPLIAVSVLAGLAFAAIKPDLFGGYSREGVTSDALSAPGLLDFSRETLAYVVVGVGMLPFALAAAWGLSTLWRPRGRDQHAFAVLAVVTVAVLTLAVGSFTARYTPMGINSRYLFYLAPLLFTGMAAFLVERRRAVVPVLAGGLLTAWVVYGAKLTQSGPSLVSPDQTFHTVLIGRTYQVGRALGTPELTVPHLLGVLVLAATLVLAALVRTRHARAAAGTAVALVAVFCVLETGYAFKKIADTQRGVDPAFVEGRRWVDEAMPDGAKAAVILSTFGDPASAMAAWWDVSFWNKKVDRSVVLPQVPDLQQPYPEQFQVLPDGSFGGYDPAIAAPGVLDPAAGPGLGPGPWFVRAQSDRTFSFRGARVVQERFGIQLLEVASPPRAAWSLHLAADDTGRLVAGDRAATLRLYAADPARPGTVRLKLVMTTTGDATKPQRLRLAGRTYRVGVGKTVVVQRRVRLSGPAHDLKLRALGPADPAAPRAGVQLTEVEAT